MVGTQPASDLNAVGDRLDPDDGRRPHQLGARHRTQADRTEREDRHRIADPHASALRTGKAGRHDVRAHQDLLVGEAVRDRAEIGHSVVDQHIFSLAAIDGIPEFPAAMALKPCRSSGPSCDPQPQRHA